MIGTIIFSATLLSLAIIFGAIGISSGLDELNKTLREIRDELNDMKYRV